MQIRQTFTVDAACEAVWRFFEDVERVGRCVPGVQQVTVLSPDRYRVVASQKVGFVSVTFEMTTQRGASEPLRFMEFSSTGKSVKGAVGDIRSRDRVEFESLPGDGTRVTLISELTVGGMLGALGHKAISAKSRDITAQFAQSLSAELGRMTEGRAGA